MRVRVRTTLPDHQNAATGNHLCVEDMDTGSLLPVQSITVRCDGRGKSVAVVELKIESVDIVAVNEQP